MALYMLDTLCTLLQTDEGVYSAILSVSVPQPRAEAGLPPWVCGGV